RRRQQPLHRAFVAAMDGRTGASGACVGEFGLAGTAFTVARLRRPHLNREGQSGMMVSIEYREESRVAARKSLLV
ncbi:hypothetical protein, partial [Vibrio alginolyticus]|uniref:hypothetical protein n=1 Tax=Vibrio alginolyticus TaxID=663 RepID=UPI001EEB946E